MELQELKEIWQSYDAKLDRAMKLNIRVMEEIQSKKVKSKLRPVLIFRVIEFIFLLAFIIFLGGFISKNLFQLRFSIPASLLMILYVVVFINCIQQIVMITQLDYGDSVSDIQKKLSLLQMRIADYVRISFLFFPLWLAFPVVILKAIANIDITTFFTHGWWVGNIIFSIAMTPICIFFYQKVSYNNMNKKWVRTIIKSMAGDSVTKAMIFTMEIDEFKKGLV